MPTDGSYSGNSLDASQHAQVDQISLAFERAWLEKKGKKTPPCIEEYFGRLQGEDQVRDVLFRELLLLDIHYRRQRDGQPGVELYQDRFPQQLNLILRLFSDTPPGERSNDRHEDAAASPLHSGDTDSRMGDVAPSTSHIPSEPGAAHDDVPAPDSLNPRYLGRYELVKQLGKGRFGRVHLARDSKLDRLVAIKVSRSGLFSSQESAARFLSEARKAAQLDKHPGIVTIHDVGCEDDKYFIVMDYVEGGTLADPKTGERFAPPEAVDLIAKVADAVHFAHTKGLLHRDIKPANILLDGSGDPKVADFGLAVHESEQSSRRGEICGTLHYMSPEQTLGHTDRLDGRTDIWSLGATLYELLTHRRPFSGDSREELVDQILHRDVKPLRQIDDSTPCVFEQICMTALNKEPSARYSTARDFSKELRQAARAEQAKSAARFRKRTWIAAGTLAVALVFLLGAEIHRLFTKDDLIPPPPPPPRFMKASPQLSGEHTSIMCIAMSGNGRYVASGGKNGRLRILNLETGKEVDHEFSVGLQSICLSDSGDRVAVLCADGSWFVLTVPAMGDLSVPMEQLPELLVPDTSDGAISAILALENSLLLYSLADDRRQASMAVSSPWSQLVAARSDKHITIAGYVAEEDEWRVRLWNPESRPGANSQDVMMLGSGPICSVAVADGGQVAIGGYGDVGVQVWLGGDTSPTRLDVGKTGTGDYYYHTVGISPDGKYVYAVSHYVPRPSEAEEKHVLLRAWEVGAELTSSEMQEVVSRERIDSPVQAAVFLPEERLLLLSVSQTLQLWQF